MLLGSSVGCVCDHTHRMHDLHVYIQEIKNDHSQGDTCAGFT